MLRKVMFAYQNQKIYEVFKSMQANNQAMAIVIGKNQNVLGLVTMEDILERIVGKIIDEFDK